MSHFASRLSPTALAALAFVVALGGASAAARAQGDVRLPGLRGGQLTSADLADGATVVVVWASWSPRCRDIVERANAIAASWGGRARVVTVDFQEDGADVERFLAGKDLRAPVYLDRDGEFSKGHAVTALPGLVVVRKGEVLFQGRLAAEAEEQILGLLR